MGRRIHEGAYMTTEQCACGHHDRYHFADGTGHIRCRATADCACVSRETVTSKQNLGSQRAADWWPFTQNHDPSFISALRDAYAQGFNAGHAEAEPDLVFHEVMHELGARDGETIFDLLKRLKSERSAHDVSGKP